MLPPSAAQGSKGGKVSIGYMNGNHTFKCFSTNGQAAKWAAKPTNLSKAEMAFREDGTTNLHRGAHESDASFASRCTTYFNEPMKAVAWAG